MENVSRCYWLKCTRPAQGLAPAEVWYAPAGWNIEQANRTRDDAAKQWPDIIYEVVDHVDSNYKSKWDPPSFN